MSDSTPPSSPASRSASAFREWKCSTRRAPSAAKARAMADPSPPEAPVMRTTLPARSVFMVSVRAPACHHPSSSVNRAVARTHDRRALSRTHAIGAIFTRSSANCPVRRCRAGSPCPASPDETSGSGDPALHSIAWASLKRLHVHHRDRGHGKDYCHPNEQPRLLAPAVTEPRQRRKADPADQLDDQPAGRGKAINLLPHAEAGRQHHQRRRACPNHHLRARLRRRGERVERIANEDQRSGDMQDVQGNEFVRIHTGVAPRGSPEIRRRATEKIVAPHLCRLLKGSSPFYAKVGAARWILLSDLRPSSHHRWFGSRKLSKAKSGYRTQHEHCRVSGDSVNGPRPRSNRKRSISREFLLAPASRQPQPERDIDQNDPAGGPGRHGGTPETCERHHRGQRVGPVAGCCPRHGNHLGQPH